ncbi:hypothetical protein RHGRI_013232 [Rhododendron griersonianum]|uniref:Auxin-responsive protein n=1 Tax=Rhododendron griersonianum TaxID=479676 RepID=A0AAV6K576_9ERIC|nr:hypothetical protein RHGRI_013232 [Rhododendron griersonianum]
MSMHFEAHDYMSLSEAPNPPMETSENPNISSQTNDKNKGLNLKATELRLGLPGSESPEREFGLCVKGLFSGAKRGFSDTLDGGSRKWVFTGSGGSDLDLAKNGCFFSPKGISGGEVSSQQSSMAANAVKEAVPQAPKLVQEKKPQIPSAAKAQVVGWPPIRSFRKNSMASNQPKDDDEVDAKSGSSSLYVKVSMEGAPYLRKVDLKIYSGYAEMSSALEKMFSCFTIGQCGSDGVPGRDGLSESRLMDLLHGSEYVLTYEDKDGDWMLVGDVPWEMFTDSCKRLRIMKSSDAVGLENSFGDVTNKVVADFGCGCGTLGLAASLLDAEYVVGLDIDAQSIEIATANAEDLELEMDFVQCDLRNLGWRGPIVDTVVMNPPFGTRKKGADMDFLCAALKIASQAVYSLHKTTTREHVKRTALRDYNAKSAEVLCELRFDVPQLYKFHKKKEVDVAVDLWRFVPQRIQGKGL